MSKIIWFVCVKNTHTIPAKTHISFVFYLTHHLVVVPPVSLLCPPPLPALWTLMDTLLRDTLW